MVVDEPYKKQTFKIRDKIKNQLSKLEEDLVSVEVVVQKLNNNRPFSEKNKKKGISILHGGLLSPIRRTLFRMRRDFKELDKSSRDHDNYMGQSERGGNIPYISFNRSALGAYYGWKENKEKLITYRDFILINLSYGSELGEGDLLKAFKSDDFGKVNLELPRLERAVIAFLSIIRDLRSKLK